MRTFILTAVLLSMFAQDAFSQGFYNSRLWKSQRNEYSLFFGASNFLGELGGRDQIGTDFLMDLEFNQTKFAGGISYQYYVGERHGINLQATIGRVAGNDNTTTEMFRQNRNIHFRSNIYEASLNYQFHFIKAKLGNIYNLKSSRGKKLGLKSLTLGLYGTVGIGGFYFNPQAMRPGSGQWVDLADLGTEGQGIKDGKDFYKKYSIAIPVGFGFRYNINKEWGMKLELAHRFTMTDYIDDVSTEYYDNSAIAAAYGADAAYFADPNTGIIPLWTDGAYTYDPTGDGMQRGDPTDRDGYLYAVLGVFYRPKATSRGRYGRGGGRRRIKASF